jgi:hypothetical protein
MRYGLPAAYHFRGGIKGRKDRRNFREAGKNSIGNGKGTDVVE